MKWDRRRIEIVVLLTLLLAGNILIGKLDEWLESKMPADAWKDIH